MLKIFRNIRKTFLSEGQPDKQAGISSKPAFAGGRYLKYAIGEILLVVVGILIALQINNWNQNRLDKSEKKEILSKLHNEFKANKIVLKDYRVAETKAISAGIDLINLIGASKDELSRHNLDSLLYNSFPANELAFANNAVNNIIQSGRLNLFKDETITTLLYQWNSLSEIRKIRFDKLDQWNNEFFIPFLLPYISLKEMDSYAGYPWTGKSKIKPDYHPLFQKIEFENLLDNSLWLHQQIIERLKETEVLIEEIINVTKP